jgi:hypothetical protein
MIRGSIEAVSNDPAERIELFLNFDDTAGVTGEACDVGELQPDFGLGHTTWSAGMIAQRATILLQPATAFQTAGVTLKRAQMQCETSVVPSSGGLLESNTLAGAPGAGHIAIRALALRFNVTELAVYGTGAQCP